MHHVKHVRKEGFGYKGSHQQMGLLNRKQVPLCNESYESYHKESYHRVHAGLYYSPSWESLRKRMKKQLDS